jgi:hypothetical protein
MKKETLKRVFDFLEEKEGQKIPFLWKLLNNIPLTKEDLIVKGDLNLEDSEITSLPEGLTIEGDFFFYHSPVELPKGLKVGNHLSLIGPNITSLPKGLEVLGWLFITDTGLGIYSDEELREMIKPGFIKGEIIR